MMADLNEAVMEGRELFTAQGESVPLDLVVPGPDSVLMADAFWWKGPVTLGSGLYSFHGALVARGSGWALDLDESVQVLVPSDAEVAGIAAESRRSMDLDRPAYLRALAQLRDATSELDWDSWLQAVQERPAIDATAERLKSLQIPRNVGFLEMLDSQGVVVDLLVLDERGEAGTQEEDGWLALFAERWMSFPDDARPSIEEFLKWLGTQSPYGGATLGTPRSDSKSGLLTDILENHQHATTV